MASTIAAITTGIGGIVTTADATGNLSLLSGTSTVVAVTSAGAAVTGTMSVSGATTLTGGLNTPLAVTSGGTGVATSTGSGANVLSTSPTLVTPLLGTVTSGNISACTSTSMVLVTPVLGTPTSGNLANCTGIPAPAALSTASGSAPSYSERAWVNFNGTGTPAIRASGNVSSITDNGTGDYTVNLTTAMADTNGTVVGASVETIGAFSGGLRAVMPSFASTSTIRLGVCYTNGGAVDMPYVGIIVIR